MNEEERECKEARTIPYLHIEANNDPPNVSDVYRTNNKLVLTHEDIRGLTLNNN